MPPTRVRVIRKSAAKAQEAIMGPHPNTISTFADSHCQDLLATVARERRAESLPTPALPWRTLAIRAVAFVAVCLGVRG
jgi:hypothetical protein